MQLNKVTHDILKNFSEINTNILIKPGSEHFCQGNYHRNIW